MLQQNGVLMKSTKFFIIVLSFILSLGVFARETGPFICVTQLDHIHGGEIKTIDLVIRGSRSVTNTFSGGVSVIAGEKNFHLNLPSGYLSDSVVAIKGTNTKDQVSLDFSYMENAEETQNLTNRASVKVRSGSFYYWATNEILSTEDENDAHPVNCDITKPAPF
jgi:hypothetical protein